MIKKTVSLTILILFRTVLLDGYAQPDHGPKLLKENWAIQSSMEISGSGSEISSPRFQTKDWHQATMPSTLLEALVNAGEYKDPYYGNNLVETPGYFEVHAFNYLYDLPEDSPFSVPWWFRTEFVLPEGDDFIWLNFSSINYKANIWLNGHLIADTTEIEGAHRLYQLDITEEAIRGNTNTLALEIIPPVRGTDLSIRWMQGTRMVPDKDAGIWYDVKLVRNGKIKIRYPHVITELNLPDTTVAFVTVSTDLYNNSDKAVSAELTAKIIPVGNIAEGGNSTGDGETYSFDYCVDLSPKETKRVRHVVRMERPCLWWPHMSGRQSLYDLQLEAKDADSTLSDNQVVRFGVREISTTLEDFFPDVDQKLVRVYYVNGKKIFIKGGNWTETAMMEENPQRNKAEILHMRNMSFNAIRTEGFWGTDHFFDLCDKYGIMIFDGPNCCSIWERWDAWSDHSYEIAGLSLRDQVIRKRNHPCFINWLLASDNPVPLRAEKIYVDIVNEYDGTRPYQSNSMYSTTPLCGCTGLDHDPYPDTYIYLHPTAWYGKKDVIENEDGTWFGKYEFLELNTEIGPGGEQIPPMESMVAMMPKEDLWPINEAWKVRQSSDEYSVNATNAFHYRYGRPADLESYTMKAQVFQKESYRAMAEAFRKNKYAASGILIYRLNAGWPSLCYFLYDYYLRPNGAYSAVQQAFEPIHIQYCYDDSTVVVVNDLYKGFKNLDVSAKVYNFNMTEKLVQLKTIDIAPDDVIPVFKLPLDIEGLTDNYFLSLKLNNEQGGLISSNFYWLSTKYDTIAQYTDLMNLPQTSLNAHASYHENGEDSEVRINIGNKTGKLAFFINPKILRGIHGEELLPSYWGAKYFSLLPGETREVTVKFDLKDLEGTMPYLMLEGWNIDPLEISISDNMDVTPDFHYRNLQILKEVGRGEIFDVSVIIKNSAEAGKGLLKSRQFLLMDGEPYTYKRVALAPGEEKRLIWTQLSFKEKGTHTVQIGAMNPVEIKVK
ncbi:MAG: hypothetical protein AMS23_05085 [Bacteroides sp. SM1_62]|nr:MAG: hypothetical protein AMS26_12355 [Bacteroides sp. SM23_62]KPL25148.1 MAG: hypothetical protein AMS23_05085 [Bacteroides sp. SM1_62]